MVKESVASEACVDDRPDAARCPSGRAAGRYSGRVVGQGRLSWDCIRIASRQGHSRSGVEGYGHRWASAVGLPMLTLSVTVAGALVTLGLVSDGESELSCH